MGMTSRPLGTAREPFCSYQFRILARLNREMHTGGQKSSCKSTTSRAALKSGEAMAAILCSEC